MKKQEIKKFDQTITSKNLEVKLSGVTRMSAYSFTKKHNPVEYNNILNLLPSGYITKQKDKLESLDLIYSGSTDSNFILTIMAGRNDIFKDKEQYDIDVFNIAPDSSNADEYFLHQHLHFKDSVGKRTSYEIHPYIIAQDDIRKDITYATYLTGSTYFNSFEEYAKQKPEYFEMHKKSFGELK